MERIDEYLMKYGIKDKITEQFYSEIQDLKERKLNVFDILIANPYDFTFSIDNLLKPKLFSAFKILDIPEKYGKIGKLLTELLWDKDNKFVFLRGFSGCGKTSFLNWYISNINSDIDCFNIDASLIVPPMDTFTTSHNKSKNRIIALEGMNNVLKDIFTYESEEELIILEEYWHVLNTVFSDFTIFRNKRKKIYNLAKAIIKKDAIDNKYKQNVIVDSGFKLSQKIALVIIFCLVKQQFSSKNDKYIFFVDNLDELKIKNLSDDIVNYIMICDSAFQKIVNSDKFRIGKKKVQYKKNFKFVFAIREANFERINVHIREKYLHKDNSIHFDNLFLFTNSDKANKTNKKIGKHSYNSQFKKWIEIRMDFAELVIGIKIPDATKILITKIISSDYHNLLLARTFNFSYRRLITFLEFVDTENKVQNNNVLEIIKKVDSREKFTGKGAQGCLFNLLIKHLANRYRLLELVKIEGKNYMKNLGTNEICNSQLNIFRVVLTSILNISLKGKTTNPKEYTFETIKNESNYVYLYKLYELLQNYYSIETFSKYIKDFAILHHEDTYYNPVSFRNINIQDQKVSDIIQYLETGDLSMLTHTDGDHRPKISINPSGFSYIRYITPHFEWFSYRCSKDNYMGAYPCLYLASFNGKTDYINYKIIIDDVYSSVEKCLEKVISAYKKYYKVKCESYFEVKKKEFILRHCNDEEMDDKPLREGRLYATRVIEQHTSYLDSYRLYILEELNNRYENMKMKYDKKVEVNKYIINIIKKYFEFIYSKLYVQDEEDFGSEIRIYNEVIKRINEIEKSNFANFNKSVRDFRW